MKRTKLPLSRAVALAVLFLWIGAGPGLATPDRFQFEGDLVLESEVVCSPDRNPTCGPGPFSEMVQVPPGVEAVNIDVYWHLWGEPEQQQTNEHSNFTASADGETLGRVYCQDFGDFDDGAELCGSVTSDVSPGQELTLEIVHADETTGDSSGSHYQIWVIDWVEGAAPSATPEVTSTAVAPSPTATSTPTEPVSGPIPPGTATSTAAPPEVTPEATATEQGPTSTPTSTEPAPLETATSTTAPTEMTPEATSTERGPTPTPTPTEPVSGPIPPGTATFTPAPTEVTPAATSTELVPSPTPTSTEPVSGPAPPGTATSTPARTEVTPAVTSTDMPSAPSPSPTPTELVPGPGQQWTATSTPVQQETEEAQQALTRTPAPTAAPTVGTSTPVVLPVTGAHLPGASGTGLLWKFGLALAGLGLVAYGLLREWRKE